MNELSKLFLPPYTLMIVVVTIVVTFAASPLKKKKRRKTLEKNYRFKNFFRTHEMCFGKIVLKNSFQKIHSKDIMYILEVSRNPIPKILFQNVLPVFQNFYSRNLVPKKLFQCIS